MQLRLERPSGYGSFGRRHSSLKGNMEAIVEALEQEERTEREADKAYWNPLRQELEQLRHDLRRDSR